MASAPQVESQSGRTPDANASTSVSVERHYTPGEIAELWSISVDCVRNIFETEPGILVIGNPIPRCGKRSYTTLRIPQSVLDRVHKRMSKV